MGRGGGMVRSVVMAVVLAVALMAPGSAAQGTNTPACAQRLIPCANYLGSAKPPDTCCDGLRKAVENERPCLCSLFNNKPLLEAFKINITQALELPKHCGITADTSICATSTTPGAGAPTTAPPATAGVDNKNTAAVARMGAYGLVCLLAFWWSLVA